MVATHAIKIFDGEVWGNDLKLATNCIYATATVIPISFGKYLKCFLADHYYFSNKQKSNHFCKALFHTSKIADWPFHVFPLINTFTNIISSSSYFSTILFYCHTKFWGNKLPFIVILLFLRLSGFLSVYLYQLTHFAFSPISSH